MNYFELFNLQMKFQQDETLILAQYQELQKRYHPDNFVVASEQERFLSEQKSTQINDAYQMLKNPLSRAECLLELKGFDIKSETQTIQDHPFLIQQIELFEELNELEGYDDPESKLIDFEAKVSKIYQSYLLSVEEDLNRSQWEDAAYWVKKLQFIVKLQNEIEKLEEKFLD